MTNSVTYEYDSWVRSYANWMGWIQLTGLNLGGLFWLAWASGMKHKENYQPVWMYWIHWLYVLMAALMTVLLLTGAVDSHIRVFSTRYDVPLWASILTVVVMGLIFAVPLFGIRRLKSAT